MNLNGSLLLAAMSGVLLGAPGCGSKQSQADDPTAMATDESASDMASDGKHACKGQNECKGQGGCKTDKNACKGQNECKGQGGCKTT
jgi:hypothetical protein